MDDARLEELKRSLAATGDTLFPTPDAGEVYSALRSSGHGMIAACAARDLYRSVPELVAEVERLKRQVEGLRRRVAEQSELLSRRAER